MSKEGLTVLLCGNDVEEMENPLVIGKAAKPKCFRNLKINDLPVIWRNSKKARMTAAAMEEWLNLFNAKMKKENRKNCRLFLDNSTCHPKVTLSNVKITWFPACNKCITSHGSVCYLHIQIALHTIYDAIFDFNCRRS
jgi:hypothetical protein